MTTDGALAMVDASVAMPNAMASLDASVSTTR